MRRCWAVRCLLESPTLCLSFPAPGSKEAIFESASYRRFFGGLAAVQLGAFGLWQVGGLVPFLRDHAKCSWRNVVSEGRWWAGLLPHVCHRDLEHLATNCCTLLVPTFLLQRLLPWWGAVGLCTLAALGSSAGSLAFLYWRYAPEEARGLGCVPWAAPRFAPEAGASAPQCPRGHELARGRVGQAGGPGSEPACDACGRELFARERRHRCEACDYNLCLGCAGEYQVGLLLHRFRSAFDEFCFFREAELVLGFDTLTTDRPFVTHPAGFRGAKRLEVPEAVRLCQPYLDWSCQSSRGSLGSSALACALSAACALWLAELGVQGWRHPLLVLFPLAALAQPLWDLAQACEEAMGRRGGGEPPPWSSVADGGSCDCAGHLAGTAVGALTYLVCLRRGGVRPRQPLVALRAGAPR